jgi:hypothetical protein
MHQGPRFGAIKVYGAGECQRGLFNQGPRTSFLVVSLTTRADQTLVRGLGHFRTGDLFVLQAHEARPGQPPHMEIAAVSGEDRFDGLAGSHREMVRQFARPNQPHALSVSPKEVAPLIQKIQAAIADKSLLLFDAKNGRTIPVGMLEERDGQGQTAVALMPDIGLPQAKQFYGVMERFSRWIHGSSQTAH